jgi:hypothetical protein
MRNTRNIYQNTVPPLGKPPIDLLRPRSVSHDLWSSSGYETRLTMVTHAYVTALQIERARTEIV